MKRAVYEAIGGLDEQFGLGLLDDDDLAIRARQAGFELAVAHDLFIHHFGSRTFAGNGIDTERLLSENQQRFAAKWGKRRLRGQRVLLRPFVGNDRRISRGDAETRSNLDTSPGELRRERDWRETELGETNQRGTTLQDNQSLSASRRLRARPVRVSLTMIVRNEEHNLPRCLESVCGLFDEIVIVDTGSTDRTAEIAGSFGARVFDFAWVDDFAAARNAALARATGDYAFWLDADDVVDPPKGKKSRRFSVS